MDERPVWESYKTPKPKKYAAIGGYIGTLDTNSQLEESMEIEKENNRQEIWEGRNKNQRKEKGDSIQEGKKDHVYINSRGILKTTNEIDMKDI